MKYISWNVNGLRAVMTKGFNEFIIKENPDFVAIQETKMQKGQADISIDGYKYVMSSAIKKGYSGTLIYYKEEPISVHYGMFDELYNDEGRLITLEYPDYYFVTAYSPNSQDELKRLDYRVEYEENLRKYFKSLKKPIIFCGDLNVAHKEIDLKNPKTNERNAGYTLEERTNFQLLLDEGYIDTFRYMHPLEVKYSWWSYRFSARTKNIGWRIDYFLVSDSIKDKVKLADIYSDVLGSDHAPILLEMDW